MDANEVMLNLEVKTDRDKIDQFLINRDEEETKITLDFAKAMLSLEGDIKELKDDIKVIKTDAKANGVSVAKVTKVLSILKQAAKNEQTDQTEITNIENVLANDTDITTMILNLTRKD